MRKGPLRRASQVRVAYRGSIWSTGQQNPLRGNPLPDSDFRGFPGRSKDKSSSMLRRRFPKHNSLPTLGLLGPSSRLRLSKADISSTIEFQVETLTAGEITFVERSIVYVASLASARPMPYVPCCRH
jgi:hypothetical protein